MRRPSRAADMPADVVEMIAVAVDHMAWPEKRVHLPSYSPPLRQSQTQPSKETSGYQVPIASGSFTPAIEPSDWAPSRGRGTLLLNARPIASTPQSQPGEGFLFKETRRGGPLCFLRLSRGSGQTFRITSPLCCARLKEADYFRATVH